MKKLRISAIAIAAIMVMTMFTATAFAAPTNIQLYFSGNAGSSISVTATSTGIGISSYTWKIRPSYSPTYMTTVKTTTNYYTFTGLYNNTTYYVAVDITDANGTTSSGEYTSATSGYTYNPYYNGYNYDSSYYGYSGYYGTAYVASTSTKLLKSADSDADAYLTLPYGAQVSVQHATGSYYYVSYNGYYGYVYSSNLSFYGYGSYYDNYYYNGYYSYYDPYYYGYGSNYYGSNTFGAQTGTATIGSSYVAVYSSPYTSQYIIGYLYSGHVVPVYSQVGDYLGVGYSGTLGYIRASQASYSATVSSVVVPVTVTTTAPVAVSVSATMVSKYNSVNVRASASVAAPLLGTLSTGDVISVSATSGDWVQITKGTLVGWVYKDNLR